MKLFKLLSNCDTYRGMKNFLSSTERDSLKAKHRKEPNRRIADRFKAILLSDKGWTYRRIAEALLIDEQTVGTHVDEYRDSKKLTLSCRGSLPKLDKMQTAQLVAHIEGTTYLTVQEICAYVLKTYGVSYTVPGMTAWMHSNGFSYKKPKATPAKADPVRQKAFIEFYEALLTTTPEDEVILFGDGVHPTMATKVTYGWIKTGCEKPIKTTASRTRMNLMGALNLESMAVTIGQHETIDSAAMEKFFDQLKVDYPKSTTIHLILDQGPYNKSIATTKSAKERGIKLHYLPPYSPNLNPIERLWKVMNEYCRNNQFFTSAKQFRQTIWDFFDNKWPEISHKMIDRINDNFQRLNPTLSV